MKRYKVLDKIVQRSRAIGGQLTFISGEQGSGKTTLMLQMLANLYKHDVCVWRGLFSAQALQLFPYQEDIVVLLRKSCRPQIYKIREKKFEKVSLRQLGYKVIRFHKITDIESHLQKDKLNVLFMDTERWRLWLSKLPHYRRYSFWLTIAIDEVGGIAPAYPKGELWHEVQKLSEGVADYRKRYVNLLMASQQPDEVDHRIRKKIQHRILGPGSRVEGHLRVWQTAIDNLRRGEAYVCSAHFEKIQFDKLKKQIGDLQIEF